MNLVTRIALVAACPLLLLGCVLTPGKFVSSLRVDADRSFSFAYKGEVIAVDVGKQMGKGFGAGGDVSPGEPGSDAGTLSIAPAAKPDAGKSGAGDAARETTNRAIAAALQKEYGYRSVVYQGKGKFMIDYAVSGVLTHNFIFPFNVDAEAVIPFVAVELRQGGVIRIKAPGFANEASSKSPIGGMGGGMVGGTGENTALGGTFTVSTDAEIISQNNEDGAQKSNGRATISWQATPLTRDAPTAVLRLAR